MVLAFGMDVSFFFATFAKKYMRKSVLALGILLLISSAACAKDIEKAKKEVPQGVTIEMPNIPDSLQSPAQRADYLTLHFWDKLDFKNTALSNDKALMEQSFVNFLSVLPYASSDSVVGQGFGILLDRSHDDPAAFKMITGMADDYLSANDSPMRSEPLYIRFLSSLADFSKISDVERLRVADRLEQVSKNRIGAAAADFSFTALDGSVSSLSASLPEANSLLMLIFFDPECDVCEEVIERIRKDGKISKDAESSKMKILAVYSGSNLDVWRKKAAELPETWTVGINDGEIDEGELYYLPQMPTIYILDSNGLVVDKNVEF